MPAQVNGTGVAGEGRTSLEEQERLEKEQSQEARINALLENGIPTLPAYVFELSSLLRAVPVDLRRVCRVIRTDPSLAAQLLRLCNSDLVGSRGRVADVESAVINVGTERLRTLVLTCSLVESVGNLLSPTQLQSFWQHSLLAATLSERSALCLRYPEVEQAYLAGLLHDLGVLPLFLLAMRPAGVKLAPGDVRWGESVEQEQQLLGVNHCLAGRCIGVSWNFSPEIVDVLEHHHRPREARHDRVLVEIVSAADLICKIQGVGFGGEPSRIAVGYQNTCQDLVNHCASSLPEGEKNNLAKALQIEFQGIIQLLKLRVAAVQMGTSLPGLVPWW
jgi:HD-like signal output (HDOD) protein